MYLVVWFLYLARRVDLTNDQTKLCAEQVVLGCKNRNQSSEAEKPRTEREEAISSAMQREKVGRGGEMAKIRNATNTPMTNVHIVTSVTLLLFCPQPSRRYVYRIIIIFVLFKEHRRRTMKSYPIPIQVSIESVERQTKENRWKDRLDRICD